MGVIPDCGLLELIVLSIPRSALRPEVINIFHPDDAVLPERPAPLNSFMRISVMSWASTMLIASATGIVIPRAVSAPVCSRLAHRGSRLTERVEQTVLSQSVIYGI